MRIAALTPEHHAAAAALLAARLARERTRNALLPAAGEEGAGVALAAALARPGAAGAAALAGDRLVAFLVADTGADEARSRWLWIRHAGYALPPGDEPRALGALLAAVGEPAVRRGTFAHFAHCAADDPGAREAFFAAGFGIQQTHGTLALAGAALDGAPPPGVGLRRATAADLGLLRPLMPLVHAESAAAPTWAAIPPEWVDDLPDAFAELLAAEAIATWVALADGEALAYASVGAADAPADDLATPAGAVELKLAGTRPEARGRGIGRAVVHRALREARKGGATVAVTDWRTANPLASAAWTRQGFRPTVLRLHRAVDPRVASAWPRGGATTA